MSAHSPVDWRLLDLTGLIVIVEVIAFKRFFWDAPVKHGSGFFFDFEVPEGFYEGAGAGWLKAWHALILAVNLILVLALVAILISGRWLLLPVWAGGIAFAHVVTFTGFRLYARAKLGANPPERPSAAVSLEPRRLRDYFWWPGEAIMAGIIAFSWSVLFIRGASLEWSAPVILTYVIVGTFLLEIGFVRMSFPPLPADRPEEHRRWMEAMRRWFVRVWDIGFRWFCATVLVAYALEHGWHAVVANSWSRWLLFGVALAVWVALVISLLRGERRLTAMGRDLRPPGSWSTPFGTTWAVPRSLSVLFFAWFGGLVVLIAVSLR